MEMPMNASEKVAHDVGEVAERLGLNVKSVRVAIEKGEIPCVRIGRRILVPSWWLRAQMNGPSAPGRSTVTA
jgi:excisionase family DNA binding protein